MIEPEQERLEESLRRISPAPAPAELIERLHTAVTAPAVTRPVQRPRAGLFSRLRNWRIPAVAGPATAVAVILCLYPSMPSSTTATPAEGPGVKASDVQVGHSLVASFDEVAQLPGAEPVRLRYREWQDEVVIKDAHGVMISQITPRIEVIPVRLEIY